MRRLLLLTLLCLPALTSLPGCTTFSGEGVEPSYADRAEENLKRGREAMEARNFPEASKYFEHVRVKYPFLEAAKEAELLLGDADFEKEAFAEARDRYESFVKLHPTHPRVDYAAFRAALTHFKEIPSDLFILPPSYDKDQSSVRAAGQAMGDFIQSYPRSQYLQEAKVVEADVRLRQARHELQVADFYAKRGRWPAVIGRLETLVTRYPGTSLDEQALFRLKDVYLRLKEHQKAADTLERVVTRMPGTKAAQRAERELAALAHR
jgi:outer membrane protein assembly factor BamD